MNNPNLGRMLRFYRKANHYSVSDVVDLLSQNYDVALSPKTIYSWENCQTQPSADNFLVLCKLYNISNILESLGYDCIPEQAPIVLTAEERELILKYRNQKEYTSAIRKLLDLGQ